MEKAEQHIQSEEIRNADMNELSESASPEWKESVGKHESKIPWRRP